MKITVYTTTDCQFSKQEREYLASHSLQYEEKNLETNKDFLTEMLAVSNNFAGTPVTRVEKDDGTIAVLKGFTPAEFDTTFGFTQPPSSADLPSVSLPKEESLAKPDQPTSTPTETPQPTTPPPVDLSTDLSSKVSTTEEVSAKVDEKLDSVLDKLEDKTAPPEPVPLSEDPAEESPITPTNVATAPATPKIPDFPAK